MLQRMCVLVLCAIVGLSHASPADAHDLGDHIPGLTPASAVAHFEAFGLTCDTNGEPNGVNPPPGLRGADCSAVFPDPGAQVNALLNYFDDGHVISVWTTIFAEDDGGSGTVDPNFAFAWSDYVAELPYRGNDAEATQAWLRDRAASGECGQGCSLDVAAGVWFMAATADGWPGQLDFTGDTLVIAPPPSPTLPNTALPAP